MGQLLLFAEMGWREERGRIQPCFKPNKHPGASTWEKSAVSAVQMVGQPDSEVGGQGSPNTSLRALLHLEVKKRGGSKVMGELKGSLICQHGGHW